MDTAAFVAAFDAGVDDALAWIGGNAGHLFDAFRGHLQGVYASVNWVLKYPPVFLVCALALAAGWRVVGFRFGVLAAAGMAMCDVMGLWLVTMDTLGLVISAAAIALVIALPVGVAAGFFPMVDRVLEPNESADKPFFHGESTVGLKGGFGSIQFGRRLDAISLNDWDFDPWFNFDRVASPAWDLWHYNFPSDPKGNNGTAEYGRLNNGVFYDSPNIGGASLHLSTSPEKATGDANKPLTAALKYKNGFFSGMVAHGKNSAGNTDSFVGVKTTFSDFSVMGAYDVSKAGVSKAKSTTLGATYRIDVTTLRAGWGQVSVNGVKAEKVLGLGATYNLSKRTSLYVDFAHKTFPTTSANTYGVGIAHSF